MDWKLGRSKEVENERKTCDARASAATSFIMRIARSNPTKRFSTSSLMLGFGLQFEMFDWRAKWMCKYQHNGPSAESGWGADSAFTWDHSCARMSSFLTPSISFCKCGIFLLRRSTSARQFSILHNIWPVPTLKSPQKYLCAQTISNIYKFNFYDFKYLISTVNIFYINWIKSC